jgi:Ni/Co efflux regulator RcnB
MKKLFLITLLLGSFGLTTAPGCIVRTRSHNHGHVHREPAHRHHRHRARPVHRHHRRPSCSPSHYWDGHQCRHKGRGHGARKHDY